MKVKTNLPQEELPCYITSGQEYETRPYPKLNSPNMRVIDGVLTDGSTAEATIRLSGCAHLGGEPWEVVT